MKKRRYCFLFTPLAFPYLTWPLRYTPRRQVPKNEYGNVEFFDCNPVFLPPGTVHLRGEQVGRVASRLGVDYAPALTGFESKQGRQVPVMDGIIVCTEHAQVCRSVVRFRRPCHGRLYRSIGVPLSLPLPERCHGR